MVCIYCGSGTQVVNSRLQKRLNHVWRRRRCVECGAVFSTHEMPAYEDSWRVKTPEGALMPFQRDKLFLSLYKSCEHRPGAAEDAGGLTATVIGLLRHQDDKGLFEAENISLTAWEVLNNFDKAAAVHYQAFHPAFF